MPTKTFKNLAIAILVNLSMVSVVLSQTAGQFMVMCAKNASIIGHFAESRDSKETQKHLENRLNLKNIPKKVQDQIKPEIDKVYKEKTLTPQELAENYFGRCLQMLGVGKDL